MSALNTTVLKFFFCVQVLAFAAPFALFFAWRFKFPISKRTPSVVLLQIFLVGLSGAYFLAFPAFVSSSGFLSCFWYNFVFILSFFAVFLLVVLRVVFLWNLDFQTRLITRFHGLRDVQLVEFFQKATYFDKFKYWCFTKRNIFSKTTVFIVVAVLEWMELAIWMIGLFQKASNPLSIARGSSECLQVTAPLFKGGAIRLAIFGVLLFIAFFRILRIKENFGLVHEMKSILFALTAMLIYLVICVAYPSVVTTTFHFVFLGCLIELCWLLATILPVLIWTYKFNTSHRASTFASKPSSEGGTSAVVDKLGNHKVSARSILTRILENEEGHELFKRYLEREFALENLLFWDAVEELKRSTNANFKLYSVVVDKFVQMDSVLCINLSSQTRDNIISCTAASSPNLEQLSQHFLKAQEEIMMMLTMDTFVRFKETPDCKNLMLKLAVGVSASENPDLEVVKQNMISANEP
jgi:hypothetical protein